MKHPGHLITAAVLLLVALPLMATSHRIDLAGSWHVRLDSADSGITNLWHTTGFDQSIRLPGTTDDAQSGLANTLLPQLEKPQVLRLTRRNSYIGAAWYTRQITIPTDWKNKNIQLKLERVIWETRVWINGQEVNSTQESLSTPHYYDLTRYLSPGTHRLTIRVDNRKKYDISVNEMAHAYTNETQIKWNGILGELSLTAHDRVYIDEFTLFPDIAKKQVLVKVKINNSTGNRQKGILSITATQPAKNRKLTELTIPFDIRTTTSEIVTQYPMGESPDLWDEFNPALYTLAVRLTGKHFESAQQKKFGMRELTNRDAKLQINGRTLFLRGTLECAIFPLTGYPPTSVDAWKKLYTTAREWGLNHIRFHSWCPPSAAFEAADEAGMYLQVELPLWSLNVNKDNATNQFLYAEADRIIREYGHHPSFCLWSMGNELQPDFIFLNNLVDELKKKDPRHLYTNTSFTFEKGHGKWPEPNDDFFITQYTDKGWVRGQGVFDTEAPSFNKDYSVAIEGMPVPLITHEIGQYAVYPNLEEIKKYTGVLDPLNFKAVANDLETKGLRHRAGEYTQASGKLAALLYKEEIERALKTNGISGFQLLDLHDFPGQGTALVGLLDAFWESKGLILPEQFREFCAPVTPLIRYEKATYTSDETFSASIELANYGATTLTHQHLIWKIRQGSAVIGQGRSPAFTAGNGKLTTAGKLEFGLSGITEASKLNIEVQLEGSTIRNRWEIWVYPAQVAMPTGNIVVTESWEEARKALIAGKKVLLSPAPESVQGVEGKFVQVFWSPVHFPDQPGTMGLLIDPSHPAFTHFPTDTHTNWQWWDLCKKSRTMVIDSLPELTPIVENVDNFMKNRRLSSIIEARCGNGTIIVSSMDLLSDIANRPVARQLRYSILKYMNSDRFKPTETVEFQKLERYLKKQQQ